MPRLLAVLAVVLFAPKLVAQTSEELLQRAKAVLAQTEGKLAVPGLKGPVEILRDRWGIAHIYAKNADDLFFAQGWTVAQDRLFQIDLWRRVAVGETAELLGPAAVPADRFARLLRYRGDMKAEWTSYAPDAEAIAVAFTRGINAYIDQLGDKPPIEFQVLGYAPRKWRPEDVLGRMSGIIMSRNFTVEVARARLAAAVGSDKARLLAPVDPPVDYQAAADLDLKVITKDILAGYQAATKAIHFTPPPSASNNWVVDGSLSKSGKPMLASDPHRTIAVPSLRYLVHLNAPGWNVIGSGEPALPGVALGHNERIAWGFTIVGTDQADIYVEKTHPEDPARYLVGDQWERMDVVKESIEVKGQSQPTAIELRFTRHGPVIHQDESKQLAFALKWAGSEPGGAAYLGSLSVARAGNRREFLEALRAWKIPSLNFVYADVDGGIGWVAAALTPMRQQGRGLLPVPGWTGRHEWQGYLEVKDLPQAWDPPRHWLATANHKILPEGYPHAIAYEWATPHRFLRIQERLDGKQLDDKRPFTLEDFAALQHDVVSLPGRELARLIGGVKFQDARIAAQARRFAAWDGDLSRGSAIGPLYAVWLQELTRDFYARAGLDKEITEALRQVNHVSHLLKQLETPTPLWFGERPMVNRDEFLRDTFTRAVARIEKLAGDDPAAWRWGKLHTVTFRHPLAKLGAAHEKAFNLGPVERPGDAHTPHNARHDDTLQQVHGASYRHLFDLADWDRGLATSTPGQSGQLGSPHYGDLLPLWAEGRYFPLAYSRGKVEEVARQRLLLTPR